MKRKQGKVWSNKFHKEQIQDKIRRKNLQAEAMKPKDYTNTWADYDFNKEREDTDEQLYK